MPCSTNDQNALNSKASRRGGFQIALIALPLAATFNLGVSHSAMAACVGTVNPLNQAVTATANNGTSISVKCGVATTSPTVSPASDGNLTVAPGNTTTYKDTTTQGTVGAPFNAATNPNTVNNTMIQFDGHGRTLTVGAGAEVSNQRVINGTNGGRNRTTVLMGAATQNENAASTIVSGGAAGSTTVTLNNVGATSPLWVGQSIVFGRFDAAQGDFFPGTAMVITAVSGNVVTLAGALPAGFEGTGPGTLPLVYNVTSNYGQGSTVDGVFYNNVVDNAGTISAAITAAEVNANAVGVAPNKTSPSTTAQTKAITSSVAGDYLVLNRDTGTIKASSGTLGNTYAVEGGGAVVSLTVKNSGLLLAERQSNVTIAAVGPAAGQTGTSTSLPGIAAVAIGQANAINIQEEMEKFTLENAATGIVRATGDYSAAVVTRAGEDIINNAGLIDAPATKGYAIGANSDPGDIRELELNNSGTINGDILAVNAASLRWYLLSTEPTLSPNGMNDRLLITSQYGQFNSETLNSGVINGNLWYSNGTHELENSGSITGNIDVDQRATIAHLIATSCSTGTASCTGTPTGSNVVTSTITDDMTDEGEVASTTYAFKTETPFANGTSSITESVRVIKGTREFSFENSGTFTGNIAINQAQDNVYSNLPNLTACSRTAGGCTGAAQPATVTTGVTAIAADGVAVTRTVTTTPFGVGGGAGTSTAYTASSVDLTAINLPALARVAYIENEGTMTGNISIKNSAGSDNTIINEDGGTLTGNIKFEDVAGAKNTVSLIDDGFTGDIAATTGAGTNTLNLLGEGTLRGDVSKFSTINIDEDPDAGVPDWAIALGKTAEATTANLNAGELEVLGTLKANTNIAAGATLEGTGTVIGNVSNSGAIDVADGTLNVTGNVANNAGSTLATTITDAATNGVLNVTGMVTNDAASSVAVTLDGYQVKNGDTFTVATTSGGVTGLPDVPGTALIDWDASIAGNNLVLTANIDPTAIAGISAPGAAAVGAVVGFDNEIGNALLGLAEESDVAAAAAQLAPETNFATQQAAVTLNQVFGHNIDMRLAAAGALGSASQGPSGLGMQPSKQNQPEGRMSLGKGSNNGEYVAPQSGALWGQGLGAGLDQDGSAGVDGYDARIYGLMFGYDNWIAANTRLGFAAGYANSSIDGEGFTARNRTDIDSYLVEAYGSVKGSGWYMTGRTGFAWHDYDTTRVLTVPLADTARGSHEGRQFNAAVEVGAPWRSGGSVLTPIASLTYSNLEQDGYAEKSNAGMGLIVGKQSNDSLVSGLGLKALVPIAAQTAIEGRAVWLHEFLDVTQSVTASFAAGGGTFTAAGPDVGRDTAALGVGIIASTGANSTFQLNYDANVRDDFISHAGTARLTVGF